MNRPVALLDATLRRAYGIFEYSSEPECVFRLRLVRSDRDIQLGDLQLPSGALLLELHMWNERMPVRPANGGDLAWGKRLHRVLTAGLRSVAAYVRVHPAFRQARAVGGSTMVFSPSRGQGTRRLLERHGFRSVVPPPLPLMQTATDSFYAWLLLRTYQPVHPSLREVFKLQRAEVWLPMNELLTGFGEEREPLARTVTG